MIYILYVMFILLYVHVATFYSSNSKAKPIDEIAFLSICKRRICMHFNSAILCAVRLCTAV